MVSHQSTFLGQWRHNLVQAGTSILRYDRHQGPQLSTDFEQGFSVDEYGKQHYNDATVAYRQSCLRIFEYLRRYGYSDYQIYLLLSCAPIQGHVAGIVDVCHLLSPSPASQRLTDFADPECLYDDWLASGYLRL